jgi:hypothetical protein
MNVYGALVDWYCLDKTALFPLKIQHELAWDWPEAGDWPPEALFEGSYTKHKAYINLLKSAGYFTYQQVQHSKILHADYIACMCFVRLSEQTVTFALYIVNKSVFITEVQSVYSAVWTKSLYNTDMSRP